MIVDCAAYVDGKRATGRLDVADVPSWLQREGAFVWLGLRMPGADELRAICAAFGLGRLDVDGVLEPHRRAVLTQDNGTTWLVLRTALYDDVSEVVSIGEISLIAGQRFVITVRHGHASPLSGARKELESDREMLNDGVAAAVVTVVEAVVDSYGPALDGFEKDAIEVEREVLSESRVRPVRRLLNLKRQVRELQLAIDALEDPLTRLTRHRHLGWTKKTTAELRATISQLHRVAARARSLSELLNAAHEANLAQVSQQQNDDMRKISAWVAIAAVPTMIAGIYGMNFTHFPELDWVLGYPLVLAVMAVACTALYRSFRRRDWL